MLGSAPSARKRRLDWWHYPSLALVVLQCALFLIPQTRPGILGAVCWILGSDPYLWLGAAGILLFSGLLSCTLWRPYWNRWRFAGYLALLGLAASPFAFSVYPSSYDNAPSLVRFRLPLDGPITVGWGGATPEVNYHVMVPDQRWAYDLVVTKGGRTFHGKGEHCADYYCYGLPVLAPCDGAVYAISDGDPDMPIGVMGGGKDAGGNQVVLEVAPDQFLFLCHLQPGSIVVKEGDQVKEGQVMGRVGNSGNTSQPHLHIHVQDRPGPCFAEGIPLYFHNYRVNGQFVERGMPIGGFKEDRTSGEIVEHVGLPANSPG